MLPPRGEDGLNEIGGAVDLLEPSESGICGLIVKALQIVADAGERGAQLVSEKVVGALQLVREAVDAVEVVVESFGKGLQLRHGTRRHELCIGAAFGKLPRALHHRPYGREHLPQKPPKRQQHEHTPHEACDLRMTADMLHISAVLRVRAAEPEHVAILELLTAC